MSITDYQSKFIAYELTRRCPSDSVEKLVAALVDAQVDLNPHQVDAALFAFTSPFSTGALLADEVGLGKTIEAGLVLSQKWAERQRRILVITPSSLRTQWHQELTEKFFLPCRLLESKSYNAAIKQGRFRPFEGEEIVICSYHFAKNKADDVHAIPWDLVVIDEAHRLRNVYKPSNVIANTLKLALAGKDKLLLTATPLQNSLLELFGLVSFIDEHTFGDLKSFREQYANLNQEQVFNTLKARLRPVCHRTLRRQVLPYIKYTQRLPMIQEFTPEEYERLLMQISQHELASHAEFISDSSFRLNSQAFPHRASQIPLGLYELPRRSGEAHLYRLNHPLAESLLTRAKNRELPHAEIRFDYGRHDGKVSTLEPFIGESGSLTASLFTIEALDQVEDYLILSAATDKGRLLNEETARRLLSLPAAVKDTVLNIPAFESLENFTRQRLATIQRDVSERNARFFEAEADKLDGWADDLKVGLERELKELDRQIKEARRAATAALTLEEKLAGQKQVKALESQRNLKRRSLFDAQDEVDSQREKLIAHIEGKMQQRTELIQLFVIRWNVE